MRPWATRTAKTALLAAGFAAAAADGLSGVALAAGSNAGSAASPGLSLGQLAGPAGVCDHAGAVLGVVGAGCQVGTAVLPPAAPAQTGRGTTSSSPGGSGTGRPACGSAPGPAVAGPAVTGGAAGVIQHRGPGHVGARRERAGWDRILHHRAARRAAADVWPGAARDCPRPSRAHRRQHEQQLR